MINVTVRVSDGCNEDLDFYIYISPGVASVEYIADLFVAISGLHRALGGEGLNFRVIGADIPPELNAERTKDP